MFRTYEPTRDRLVAVKVFRLDITPEQAQALADELSRATLAGLFHPSIVEPIGAGVEGTVAYRAEEYVAAESLDVAMRHYAPASLDKALPFITQLAGAIDFARAEGVGHGALHLRDVFVTPDESRASGFGVVEALERVGLRPPVRRPYSAPERIAGEAWSTPADVFSLAAIAYELLSGRRASGTGEQMGPLEEEHAGGNPEAVRQVLARAMADDPARRYPTALVFATTLEAAARSERPAHAGRHGAATIAPAPGSAAIPAGGAAAALPGPETAPESAATPCDVEREEEADEADHELTRVEARQADAPTLFDDEAASDLAFASSELAPFAEEFREAPDEPTPLEEVDDLVPDAGTQPDNLGGANGSSGFDVPVDGDELNNAAEAPRAAMLPLAVTLVLGLLLGFAAGYAVGGRTSAAPSRTLGAAISEAPARAATPPQNAKEFSDQTVTQPPATPPAIPDETATAGRGAPSRPVTRSDGEIVIRSTPTHAGVTVNGTWRGRTPLTLGAMKFGDYQVRVVQPGFVVASEEVTLSATEPSRTLSFRLASAPSAAGRAVPKPSPPRAASVGGIYVDSRPSGARVLLDGRAVGSTPVRIPDIPAGPHVVRLELAGHRPLSIQAQVSAAKEKRVTASLERIQ